MAEDEERYVFPAVTGFRVSVPPDRPDLLLLELKTSDAGIIRFSITKESAFSFSREVAKVATPSS